MRTRPERLATTVAAVLDALPNASYVADVYGRLVYVSPGWRAFVQGEPTLLDELGDAATVHVADAHHAKAAWRASRRRALPFRDIYRLSCPGGFRWVVNQANPLRATNGRLVGWVGTLADAGPERVADDGAVHAIAAAAMHAHDAAMRAQFVRRLMAASDDCVAVLGLDGRLLATSETGCKALGIAGFGEIAGADWLTFWEGRNRDAAAAALAEARLGGIGRFSGPFTVRGRERWRDVTATPILDEASRPERLLVVSRDVSESRRTRVRLEAAYARERRIATTLQNASLPDVLPCGPAVEFHAAYRPRSGEATIGGDWYDAFVLDDGRIAFSIGDVLGHGLAAAVTMGRTRQAMRAAALLQADPNAMLAVADRTVCDEGDGVYATAIAGIVDPVSRECVLASAGHPGPLLCHPDGHVDELPCAGVLLGLRTRRRADATHLCVGAGASLVLYTDGLVEQTHDGEAGLLRLRSAIAEARHDAPADVASRIVDRVLGDAAAGDDVAVLIARFAS